MVRGTFSQYKSQRAQELLGEYARQKNASHKPELVQIEKPTLEETHV